ncbi:hypothetical protein ACFVYG_40265 [Streptomyces sp. NPDC058256]|uniref:hypothetical protein n=1 Tax=Streptomyces sp. NPDC058256 TaxID=3346408 RepID=UPI0036EF404F
MSAPSRADIDWIGYGDKTPLAIARTQDADDVVHWLRSQRAKTCGELSSHATR